MKSNTVIKTILIVVFFFFVGSISAQPVDPDDEWDPEDAPLNPVPISDYILPMLVVGVATAFFVLRKKDLQVKNS